MRTREAGDGPSNSDCDGSRETTRSAASHEAVTRFAGSHVGSRRASTGSRTHPWLHAVTRFAGWYGVTVRWSTT